ncbi:hypothetical protein HA520_19855 [Azotobacter chroococcum]|uniref:Uncharacterized protein n=1 Tax=Azotobacter chroococcum TaxID=353 RepID=A0AA44C8D1_9GAMM|nr:hypothetical protein [Azotobacter chroococcum]
MVLGREVDGRRRGAACCAPSGREAGLLQAANLAGYGHFDHLRLPLPVRLGENSRLFRFSTPRRRFSDAQPS